MDWKRKKKPLMGFVGGLGVVAVLGSVLAGFYPLMVGIFLALAIWIVGATLIGVLAG